MGNPTSYRGKTLTWEGKRLMTVSQQIGNSVSAYSFEYDENGLRTRKTYTVNGVYPQTTSYYYNGSVLNGIKPASILNTVNSPLKVEYHPQRGTYKFWGSQGVVVLNSRGIVVTTYATGSAFWRE